MITTTLFLIFSFLSVFCILLGVFLRSPVITIAGAMTFLFTGLASAIGGVTEYDGTMNKTTFYDYNASGGLVGSSVNATANYVVRNDLLVQGWSVVMFLGGIAGLYYGATMGKVQNTNDR